jgi:O-antigen/teichoic acid export membrane protein
MFASGLLDRLYSRMDSFIIGKIYQPDILGYYYRAQSMEGFVRTFSAGGIMSSLFPYIAKHQQDIPHLKEVYNRYLHVISFASVGLSAVLFVLSKDLFIILFTERWIDAAVLFQLMMLAGIVWPISSLMVNMISGLGNSKRFFRLELYKKGVMLPAYLFGFLWGLHGFIMVYVALSYVCLCLNMIYVNKEIRVSFWKQVKLMAPYILLGAITAALTWLAVYFVDASRHFLRVTIIASLFSLIYITCAWLLNLKGIEILNKIMEKMRNFMSKG